jgi:acyl-CoA thioesterase
MTRTPLSSLLAERRRTGDGTLGFQVPEDWLQGRTSFGGLVSVLAVQAMRDVAAAAWPQDVGLRALQTNFIAPVEGGPVEVAVQVLREGRNVRQVQARLMQRGEVCALAVGVFGSARESSLAAFAPERPAPARAPEDIAPMPFVPGRRPHFTAHFDMRWSGGAPPFSRAEGSRDASIHLRLVDADDAKALSPELMTVMMADVSPTPVLSQFDRPTPASSVSWSLELRSLPEGEPLDGWWRADNLAIAAAGGYVNQQSMLWSPSGSLAGLAYQVVTVYG